MLNRIASYIFLGSLFAVIILWGYLPRLWLMGWPQLTLLALAGAGLLLWVIFSLESLRLWFKKRSTQFGLSLAITAVGALVILGTVNWYAAEHNVRKDFTANQFHTLSDQTKKIAANLKENVTIRVWTTGIERMSPNVDMRRFLENYKIAGNGKITVEIKNPNEDRPGAEQDSVKRDNIVVVKSASGREARVDSFTDTKGEEQITNALVQAIKGRKKTVCFVSGHGEMSLDDTQALGLSAVKTQLNDSSYDAKEIILASAEKCPQNAKRW